MEPFPLQVDASERRRPHKYALFQTAFFFKYKNSTNATNTC